MGKQVSINFCLQVPSGQSLTSRTGRNIAQPFVYQSSCLTETSASNPGQHFVGACSSSEPYKGMAARGSRGSQKLSYFRPTTHPSLILDDPTPETVCYKFASVQQCTPVPPLSLPSPAPPPPSPQWAPPPSASRYVRLCALPHVFACILPSGSRDRRSGPKGDAGQRGFLWAVVVLHIRATFCSEAGLN